MLQICLSNPSLSETPESSNISVAPKANMLVPVRYVVVISLARYFQNAGWPEIEFYRDTEKDEVDIARDMTHRENCEALVALMRTTGDRVVELYGVWDGDFANVPQVQESISVERLLDPDFYFKEQGFYRFCLEQTPNSCLVSLPTIFELVPA